jgi:phosphopantetheine--protein transferase-like protein
MHCAGTGVDIVELERFSGLRFPERFIEYVLRPEERTDLEHSRDQRQFLASRFAVKEAVMKACPHAITWQDIQIAKSGKKLIARFVGSHERRYIAMVSMAHGLDHAVAIAHVMRIRWPLWSFLIT